MKIVWKGSPNFSKGRGGKKIKYIVIHWIVGKLSAADAVFASTARQSSAHYAVGNGVVHQYVAEENTAWHCGVFASNQESIGIEHEGGPTLPITDGVYKTSAELIASIWKRHGIIPLRKHSEFKATQCPGTLDLARLERLARDIIAPPDPCANLKKDLDAKNAQVTKLEASVRKLGSQLDASNISVNQKNAEIIELNETIDDLKKQLSDYMSRPPEEVIVEKTIEVEPSWLSQLRENIKKFFGG